MSNAMMMMGITKFEVTFIISLIQDAIDTKNVPDELEEAIQLLNEINDRPRTRESIVGDFDELPNLT